MSGFNNLAKTSPQEGLKSGNKERVGIEIVETNREGVEMEQGGKREGV